MKFSLLIVMLLSPNGLFFTQRGVAAENCGNLSVEKCGQKAPLAFHTAYTDRYNNLFWSRALPGMYRNGCQLGEGFFHVLSKCNVEAGPYQSILVKADESDAANACKAIGARLPTRAEFLSLIVNFDHTDYPQLGGPILTERGGAAMGDVFGDMAGVPKRQGFWTSTVLRKDSDRAYVFSASTGDVSDPIPRYKFDRVRCVVSP